MKVAITELYRCGECSEVHDDEDEARECCRPVITTLYVCPVCAAHHEDEDEAIECCNIEGISCPQCRRDYSSISIDYSAIKITGHCNTCNPMFTIDQQIAVQDLHYQQTGKRQHLHD